MSDKHLSSQFDADLNAVSSKVLEMGGLVESQIVGAMYALNEFDREAAEQVVAAENAQRDGSRDRRVRQHHRAPPAAARDLRLLMAISKTITNLERAGDEAEKIAKRVRA
jgi:phosphate transport system protein